MADSKDTEYELKFANQTAVVSPFGASLRRYVVDTDGSAWDVIWGYSGGANKKGGQGDVLVPFPGRIKGGVYSFEGEHFELEKNDKDGPNAIHGFLRSQLYKTQSITSQQAVFTYELKSEKGYPFSLLIEIIYALSAEGLKTSYRIENVGAKDAPAAIGFHPYFRADVGSLSEWSAEIPAKHYVELEKLVPTGRILPVDGTKLDFQNGRMISDVAYNDCLAHLKRDAHGIAQISLQAKGSKWQVTLRLDRGFDYVVIYTGDQIPAPHARQGFAIEPMTCAPDAFNHQGWGTQTLKPGAEMSGSYVVHV